MSIPTFSHQGREVFPREPTRNEIVFAIVRLAQTALSVLADGATSPVASPATGDDAAGPEPSTARSPAPFEWINLELDLDAPDEG
jgi:hypothetical protein